MAPGGRCVVTLAPAEWERVEIRVGRIERAEGFPEARRSAYRLWIDFGPHGIKRSSAQITGLYTPDELVGRLVIAVTNFAPKQIANFMSEVLVLGLPKDGEIALLGPDREVPLGERVF